MAKHELVRRPRRNRRTTAGVAGVLLVALLLAACGSSSKTPKAAPGGTTAPTTTPKAAPLSTELGNGVTATEIKVGISLINFDCIEQFTDSIRIGQQQIYQAFIDNINANGGVAGRKIVPIYKTYCPIGTATILAACTSLTEDSNVFAVIGTFYDPSGDSQLCIANQHKRVLLTFDLTQAIMSKSPPGLIVTPASNPERLVRVLLELLDKQKTLEGRTIAVLGTTTLATTVKGTIEPGLKKLGVKTGSTALLTVGGTDTTAAQAQLDSFIERWKTEHVDTVFLSSYEVSSQQFVTKLRQKMPNLLLLSDNTQVLSYGQQSKRAKSNPNPYDGVITAGGETHSEYAAGENWKFCKDIYKKQTGKTAPGPDDVIPYKTGKTLDTYGVINDACQLLTMFQDIGNRVGKYLDNTNWVNTVNNFGHIENRGSGPYSSLKTGKYDADDNFRLESFDSTLPPDGNWKPITPLQNITG